MAIYDNLPVFKDTYDLMLKAFKMGSNFHRDIRYTLGEDLKKELMKVLKLIYKANAGHDKITYISEARETMVGVKLMFRLLMDMKQLSVKQYSAICLEIDTIAKQLTSWAKYQHSNKV